MAMSQSQMDMRVEASRSYEEQKSGLAAQYNKLVSVLPKSAKNDLVRAQSAWISFRDLECDFESSGAAGGSVQPTIRLGCLEDLTRQRIAQIKAQLDCEEGDMSCVRWTAR
jgi:uncharacterized protein YecT (DUF1311 family)